MAYRIHGDVFVEPCDDAFLVYAPLHSAAFTVNKIAADFICELKQRDVERIPEEFAELVGFLDELGVLGAAPAKPESAQDPFNPTQAYLLLTANCNLRCGYCFSHGGESKTNLATDVAKAAIDLIIKNAAAQGTSAKIRYHGGGEPTLRWDTMTETAQYLRDQASAAGVASHIALNTNGVLSDLKIEWIIKNVDAIYVSFDGPREQHNAQRPLAGGRGSFDAVWRTMQALTTAKKKFAVRSTITAENCNHMAELVAMVADFSITGIELEPLTLCGRAYTSGANPPTPAQYINAYKAAHAKARALETHILYSGVRLDGVSPIFCGAAGRNFAVTPSGHATLCHRVSDPNDEGADTYFYGGYSKERGRFEFDLDKISKMAGLHCEKSEACSDCFAKWNCAGGCYSQNQAETGELLLSNRNDKCEITRELTKHDIIEKLKSIGGANDADDR